MIVRQLDGNGDWLWGLGRSNYLTYNQAIAQCVDTRLISFLGDCFFSTTDGIDWINLLSSKNQLALNIAVSACILNSPGVTSLTQLSINLNSLTRTIRSVYGFLPIYPGVNTGTFNLLVDQSGNFITTEQGDDINV